jgi:hypothetical protein
MSSEGYESLGKGLLDNLMVAKLSRLTEKKVEKDKTRMVDWAVGSNKTDLELDRSYKDWKRGKPRPYSRGTY